MRGILCAALATLALGSTSMSSSAEDKELTLYCPGTADTCAHMATEFQKDTGIIVNVLQKSAGEVLAQVRAEAENPKGDVWWMGVADSHLAAAEEGLTVEHDDPQIAELAPWAQRIWQDSSKHAVGIYGLVLGFSYNTEVLATRNLPAPMCWADLIKPEYKGEIQIANPNSSGTAYAVLATLVQLMGEDPAFEYLKALHHNISDYTKSGVAPAKAAARGETAIGIGFMQDALVEQNAGFPIQIQAPCEGTGLGVDSMSIIKGAPHEEAAAAFYSWALSSRGQAILGEVGMMHTPANGAAPTPTQDPGLDGARIIDYDFKAYGASDERARLLARWDAEVGSLPR
jgi:iron(III) transport system substrate-binding protein